MKLILLILSGLAMSLVAFAGGVLTTIIFLTAEPQQNRSLNVESSGLWTTAPARVNDGPQDVERMPARPAGPGTTETASNLESQPSSEESEVDTTVTGAIASEKTGQPRSEADSAIRVAHAAWCEKRFRSYRPDDNSYRPYGGGRRPCISPYIEAIDALAPKIRETDPYAEDSASASLSVELTSAEEPSEIHLTAEHVDSCFSRYRSYRPQDNTYQPYSGGPRRQCE